MAGDMTLFSGLFTQVCTLSRPGTETQNEMGETIPGTPTVSQIPCLFFQPKGELIDISSGAHIRRSLQVMTKIRLAVGDTISSTHGGYEGPYLVKSCIPASTFGELDHWESDLEDVQ